MANNDSFFSPLGFKMADLTVQLFDSDVGYVFFFLFLQFLFPISTSPPPPSETMPKAGQRVVTGNWQWLQNSSCPRACSVNDTGILCSTPFLFCGAQAKCKHDAQVENCRDIFSGRAHGLRIYLCIVVPFQKYCCSIKWQQPLGSVKFTE